jgi:hypothetical protein
MPEARYRAAIVGARRGLHHYQGYSGLEDRARVVALAELDPERRAAAGDELGPDVRLYADWLEMLERERPHVLHVVTNPTIPRAPWVAPAAVAGVQVLALEKPVALRPSEAHALERAAQEAGIKVTVNLQRRYMPFAETLLDLLADGERGLGPVHFVRGSVRGFVTDMYPHLADLILLAMGDAAPTHVWATAEGRETAHLPSPGPQRLLGEFSFANGARAFYEFSPTGEPAFGSRDFPATYPAEMKPWGADRCNIDIWAERGRAWWRENGTWGYQVEGRPTHITPSAFLVDDLPAQRAYTTALYDWIEGRPHRCQLPSALAGFWLQQGALHSALLGRRIAYPAAAAMSDEELDTFLERLGSAGAANGRSSGAAVPAAATPVAAR